MNTKIEDSFCYQNAYLPTTKYISLKPQSLSKSTNRLPVPQSFREAPTNSGQVRYNEIKHQQSQRILIPPQDQKRRTNSDWSG